MSSVRKNYHNGVEYTRIEDDKNVECALSCGDIKYILFGKPAIEIMKGSYKYGNQVQITVYGPIGATRKASRVGYAKKYDRMEMFLDKKVFTEMCRSFLDMDPTKPAGPSGSGYNPL